MTIRAKYFLDETDFTKVTGKIKEELKTWVPKAPIGESIEMLDLGKSVMEVYLESEKNTVKNWHKQIKKVRYGIPLSFSMIVIDHLANGLLVEVVCKPAMWYKITTLLERNFTQNNIEEALQECQEFVKEIMSPFRGRIIEPASVYPIIPRTEIKTRLQNLGLLDTVKHLDKAEEHISQNNFSECLKSSRTAFEKMVDWQMKKRGLEQTNNYKNDMERLKSKGYLDGETADLIQTHYRWLSITAVHDKGGVEPGFYEAQMGYRTTLIMLDYFANKLP